MSCDHKLRIKTDRRLKFKVAGEERICYLSGRTQERWSRDNYPPDVSINYLNSLLHNSASI